MPILPLLLGPSLSCLQAQKSWWISGKLQKHHSGLQKDDTPVIKKMAFAYLSSISMYSLFSHSQPSGAYFKLGECLTWFGPFHSQEISLWLPVHTPICVASYCFRLMQSLRDKLETGVKFACAAGGPTHCQACGGHRGGATDGCRFFGSLYPSRSGSRGPWTHTEVTASCCQEMIPLARTWFRSQAVRRRLRSRLWCPQAPPPSAPLAPLSRSERLPLADAPARPSQRPPPALLFPPMSSAHAAPAPGCPQQSPDSKLRRTRRPMRPSWCFWGRRGSFPSTEGSEHLLTVSRYSQLLRQLRRQDARGLIIRTFRRGAFWEL